MTDLPRRYAPSRIPPALWGLLGGFLALHLGMMIYDTWHPDVFLRADRALSRWKTIENFLAALQAGGVSGFLARHGNPGDYVVQGLTYLAVGRTGLILGQVLLMLGSGYALFRIAGMVLPSTRAALVATGLYLAMPHTLVLAHQLASEAIHTPLLVISLWLLARQVSVGHRTSLTASALALGLANLVRPVTLLWPLVCSGLLLKRMPGQALAYLTLSALPVLAWSSFVLDTTGEFGMGASSRGMGANLYQRVSRIAQTLPADREAAARAEYLRTGDSGTLSPIRYLAFALDFPGPVLQHSARDVIVMVAKSGVERVTIDYLKVGDTDDRRLGWREVLETQGPVATLTFLWRTQAGNLAVALLGAAAMVGLMALAVTGAVRLALEYRSRDVQARLMTGLLIALPIYVVVFSQLVNAAQSRHRAPAEAALVILAVHGYCWLTQRFGRQGTNACR